MNSIFKSQQIIIDYIIIIYVEQNFIIQFIKNLNYVLDYISLRK